MKYQFEEKDIKMGSYVIKQTTKVNSKNLDYASTVAFLIGHANLSSNLATQTICLINFLTDGWVTQYKNEKSLVDHLNSDGYRPMTPAEVVKILRHKELKKLS